MKRNLLIIASIIVCSIVSSVIISSWYWKRKYKNEIKKQIEKITDSLTDSFEAQKQLLISGQNLSKTTRTKSKKIDDKLKEDEKTIDNRDYDADAIDNLLSRFDKGSQ